jgi:hypothetical protein
MVYPYSGLYIFPWETSWRNGWKISSKNRKFKSIRIIVRSWMRFIHCWIYDNDDCKNRKSIQSYFKFLFYYFMCMLILLCYSWRILRWWTTSCFWKWSFWCQYCCLHFVFHRIFVWSRNFIKWNYQRK